MRNQDLVGVNELNKNANGGTELTTRRLFDLLEPEDLEGVQIITSRVRDLDPDKIRIYHLHDLPLDPEASHLKDEASRQRFDKIVFSSNWQYQQFQTQLGIPYSDQCAVIETGVDPIPLVPKSTTGPIKLIYTSTPHRGLELLVPVFEWMAERHDIELDIYSSFKLYGWEQRDQPYQQLFERAKAHPKIRYHGAVSNEEVRTAYQMADIFAYPSIWLETSCRCLIEAMMAGCICIHPNLGALSDTSGGLTAWYSGSQDPQTHASLFARQLEGIIATLEDNREQWKKATTFTHVYATQRFGWPSVIHRWKKLIQEVKAQ